MKTKLNLTLIKVGTFLVLSFVPRIIYFVVHNLLLLAVKRVAKLLQVACAFMPSRDLTYPFIWLVNNAVEKIRVAVAFSFFLIILCLQFLTTLRHYDKVLADMQNDLNYKP